MTSAAVDFRALRKEIYPSHHGFFPRLAYVTPEATLSKSLEIKAPIMQDNAQVAARRL